MFIGVRDKSKWVWNKVGCELTACQLCCGNKNNYEKEVRSLALTTELLPCWSWLSCLPSGNSCCYNVKLLLTVSDIIRFFARSTSSESIFSATSGRYYWHWQKQEKMISINCYVAWKAGCSADTDPHGSVCNDFRGVKLTYIIYPEEFYCTCKLLILLLLCI